MIGRLLRYFYIRKMYIYIYTFYQPMLRQYHKYLIFMTVFYEDNNKTTSCLLPVIARTLWDFFFNFQSELRLSCNL